jgi:hypothetical protein
MWIEIPSNKKDFANNEGTEINIICIHIYVYVIINNLCIMTIAHLYNLRIVCTLF